MVRVWIDGKEIETEQGKTILQVAKENGIYIPTLCYHEKLSPIGACRLCIVEIEGYEEPQPSCMQVVQDGMVIRTNSERLYKMRREILGLLLKDHPLDCPVCDKAGDCRLQDLVYEFGYDSEILDGQSGMPLLAKGPEPYATVAIKYYPSRCVLCQRCVYACREVVQRGVLAVDKDRKRIEVVRPERCISCGECVGVCPVGALVEDVTPYRARPWQEKVVRTVCPYCGLGCVVDLHVFEDKVVKATADEGVPPNRGSLCFKGRFGWEFLGSADRLLRPLIREGGYIRGADWDEALDFVAKRLKEIKDRFGPSAIAGLCSARCTNEDNYVFQKFMRVAIGSNNVDHCARL